jgi:hypothetical protein
MGNKVWVKLVIGGDDDRYDAFGIKITSETDVDDLVNAIVEKAQRLFDKDIHSLNVYPPGTNGVLGPEDVKPLRPGLPLSDLDFRETTDETPLIVTAKSRPQQQQDTNVSLYTYRAVVVLVHQQQKKFALRIQCFVLVFSAIDSS